MFIPQTIISLKRVLLIAIVLFLVTGNLIKAQNLNEQHESLMKVSTTYQDYKVIKIDIFNQFWENLQDTITVLRNNQLVLNEEIVSLRGDLSETKTQLEQINVDLESSNFVRDRISFIGIPLKKGTYNIIVWGLIFILCGLVVFFFLRFKRSNTITRSTKKECNAMTVEFDNYKKNARDKDLVLKRELQTALNTIDELKQ